VTFPRKTKYEYALYANTHGDSAGENVARNVHSTQSPRGGFQGLEPSMFEHPAVAVPHPVNGPFIPILVSQRSGIWQPRRKENSLQEKERHPNAVYTKLLTPLSCGTVKFAVYVPVNCIALCSRKVPNNSRSVG
jgi:hypothetical protein